jgi:hypothetical protein
MGLISLVIEPRRKRAGSALTDQGEPVIDRRRQRSARKNMLPLNVSNTSI